MKVKELGKQVAGFFIDIGDRAKDLVKKLISVKGLGLGIATVALMNGKIDSIVWFFTLVLVVSIRLLEKLFVPK